MTLRAPASLCAQAAEERRGKTTASQRRKFFLRVNDMFTQMPGLYGLERYGAVPRGFPDRLRSIFFARSPKEAFQTAGGFWPNRRCPDLSSFVGVRQSEGNIAMKKIDISVIPELGTSVGMHNSVKQKEVGGPICLGIIVAIIQGI
jgi:hypothetical protein